MTAPMFEGKYRSGCRATAAIIWLAFLLSLPLGAQTPPLTLIQATDSSRAVPLRSIRQDKQIFASITDVAQALSLAVNERQNDYQLDVSNGTRTATFIADNPFVVITEGRKERTAQQLSLPVLMSAGLWYAPLPSFATSFERIFGVPATYDTVLNAIRVAKPRPPWDISKFTVEEKANGTIIRLPSERQFTDVEVLHKDDGWIYVTIPGAKANVSALKAVKPSGVVKRVVVNQFPSSLQLAFHTTTAVVSAEVVPEERSNDIVLILRGRGTMEKPRSNGVAIPDERKRYQLDVIVLDAGHGGKDPGTIGVKGTYEKNVVLPIVLKLGKLIEKHLKGVKVVYTRDSDKFVELDKRGQIANENDGKLFISVHANAMPRKPHPRRGFEVYLLRPGRTDEAIAIAERENSVIELEEGYEQRYKQLTDENFILVTMAQAAHMKSSERFAELLAREMGRTLDMQNNGVLQAGFYVLVGASMPNVLIETGYLSNREDEKLLRSPEGQQRYAEAIFSAIKKYKAEYEKLLSEGSDLGAASRE